MPSMKLRSPSPTPKPKLKSGLPGSAKERSAKIKAAIPGQSRDASSPRSLIEKAAVLVERLARNHPLPDGNKRAAFLSVWLFVEMNDRPFAGEDPDVDVPMMERIAAGESGGDEIAQWLAKRTAPSG